MYPNLSMIHMADGELIVKRSGSRATLTLNRPEKLNTLTPTIIDGVARFFRASGSDEAIRSVVITGAGGKAFCAGMDVSYFVPMESVQETERFIDAIQGMCFAIEESDKIAIAAINGYCLGGGCELAMACDIRIASSDSKFGQPESRVGIIPGAGGTQRLPALIGVARAKELMLTGESIDAGEALNLGLVNRVVDSAALGIAVDDTINKIEGSSFHSLRSIKRIVNASFRPAGYGLEKAAFADCLLNGDGKEGIDAFLSKRKPKFK